MGCSGCKRENPPEARFCMGCGRALALRCGACGSDLPGDASFCPRCGHPASGIAPTIVATPSTATTSATSLSISTDTSFAAGRYRVVRKLGEGGSKRVHLAHDTLIDREVAIGVIKTEGLDETSVKRVRHEARAMGRLGDHPNIVSVHDVSEDGEQLLIVVQYMAGGDLQQRLRRADNHRLEVDEALRMGEEVCAALEHAHEHNIIHRDIKPGNIWLDENEQALLGDFGLSRAMDRTRITQQGMMVGTAAYMAPEQAMGGGACEQSDLYSLGATLYELLTGRPPFVGDDAVSVISQHLNTPPVKPSWHNAAVPRDLDTLLVRLLAKDPEERPASAMDVGHELRRLREAGADLEPSEPDAPGTGLQADPFIGRQKEQEQLRAALVRVLSGEGTTAMVVGEPGIGKTRLTNEFTTYARLRGAVVIEGNCYEGGVAVPYFSFVEAFRQYVRTRDDESLRSELGPGAPEVATLISEVRRRLPEIPEAPPLEGEADRIRLFESIASFVRSAAATNPLVIVLDDLHWADKPTLLLFQHLARCIASERVLLIGTYRDVELERTHPLSEIVVALRQEQLYERVLLRGLSFDGVRDLLRARSGQDPPEGFVQRILDETEGNPFFVSEVLLHLAEIGAIRREDGQWVGDLSVIERSIPEGVREVIGRRLSLLDEPTNQMLTIGSAMPDGFSYELLTRVSELEEDALLDALDNALRAQLIVERKDDRGGAYAFTHALIRQTLYGELNTPRRVRLHGRIGEALEGLHASNLEPQLGALAYHFFQAVQTGGTEKAVDYSRRAGERALGLLAYEEAAEHFDRALQAMEFAGAEDESDRGALFLRLGHARFRSSEGDAARDAFQSAAEIAGRINHAEMLAEAALGFAGPDGTFGEADPTRLQLLESALEKLGTGDSSLRVRLLSRLAGEFAYSREHARGLAIAEEAVAEARRLGDSSTLAVALRALRVSIGSPDDLERQREVSEEALRCAKQAGDREVELSAFMVVILDLRATGEWGAARRALEEYDQLAAELRQPYHRWWSLLYGASNALWDGRFEEAEQLSSDALEIGLSVDRESALLYYGTQLFINRNYTGGFEDYESLIQDSMSTAAATPMGRCMRASMNSLMGREVEARREFEELAEANFEDIPKDGLWTLMMCSLSGTCVRLRDKAMAARLCEMLLPYAGRVGIASVTSGLPVCESLAGLAELLERYQEAEGHYRENLAWAKQFGNHPMRVRSLIDFARMHLERAGTEDIDTALELLNEALPLAREMGMSPYVEQALALKMRLQGVDSRDASRSIFAVANSVRSRRPSFATHVAKDGTVTLMFSDLEGFTEMTERLGDTAMHELMQVHNAIVREQVLLHGGHEVELRGDGFLLAFDNGARAVRCAIGLQRAFAQYNEEHPLRILRVRIGLHCGEAIRDEERFFGKTVIHAYRVADLAHGGEILVSTDLERTLRVDSQVRVGEPRETVLKGFSGTHQLFPVLWE